MTGHRPLTPVDLAGDPPGVGSGSGVTVAGGGLIAQAEPERAFPVLGERLVRGDVVGAFIAGDAATVLAREVTCAARDAATESENGGSHDLSHRCRRFPAVDAFCGYTADTRSGALAVA